VRVLDLYCCAGGAGEGYRQAGGRVIGVDRVRHKRNPGPVIVADALDLPVEFIRLFDLVHASPPCQGMTEMNNDKSRHLNLIPQTRALLEAAGVPYVIENVRAARQHLINPVSLTGTMFDCHMVTSTGQRFDLSRERLFETNWPLTAPHDPGPRHPIANVFGGHLRARSGPYRTGNGTGRTVDFPGEDRPALARHLMGMPWASMGELSEAVPPAYTRWIGQQFMAWARRAAA
jgi:DNA (cytosine-5)-methyltransferase 1